MYILPRSTRRISFLLFDDDDNDDELATFAGAFGAAEVVDEDILFGREMRSKKWRTSIG